MRYSDITHGYHVFKEGDAWMAVGPHFVDLVESIVGFGSTPEQAVAEWRSRIAASSYRQPNSLPEFDWFTEWRTIEGFGVKNVPTLPGAPKFLGYIPQNYSVYRGGVASHQQKYIGLLEKGIADNVVGVLEKLGVVPAMKSYKLGDVKDFGQLVPASQREGSPLSETGAGTPYQRREASMAFKQIATRIVQRTSTALAPV